MKTDGPLWSCQSAEDVKNQLCAAGPKHTKSFSKGRTKCQVVCMFHNWLFFCKPLRTSEDRLMCVYIFQTEDIKGGHIGKIQWINSLQVRGGYSELLNVSVCRIHHTANSNKLCSLKHIEEILWYHFLSPQLLQFNISVLCTVLYFYLSDSSIYLAIKSAI